MKSFRSFLILSTLLLSSTTFAEPPRDDATTKWIEHNNTVLEKMRELDKRIAQRLDLFEKRCGPITKLTPSNHCMRALAKAFAHKLPKPETHP